MPRILVDIVHPAPAQHFLRAMEWCASKFAKRFVADAQAIADHLEVTHDIGPKTIMTSYGANRVRIAPELNAIDALKLQDNRYYLVVARLEPENHILEIVRGFVGSDSSRELVVVGYHIVGTDDEAHLLSLPRDSRVRFVDGFYDQNLLLAARWYCHAYFDVHSVGGTNSSLLEAMACKNYVVAHENAFNRKLTRDAALFFSSSDNVQNIVNKMDAEQEQSVRDELSRIADTVYIWHRIVEQYSEHFGGESGL